MQDVEPEEEYILVIDADMIMRSPFFPKAMGVAPGISPPQACQQQAQSPMPPAWQCYECSRAKHRLLHSQACERVHGVHQRGVAERPCCEVADAAQVGRCQPTLAT